MSTKTPIEDERIDFSSAGAVSRRAREAAEAKSPARILDRAMMPVKVNRHDHIFIIRQRWQSADEFHPQWVEDSTVVETASFQEMIDELMKLDGPKEVTEIIKSVSYVEDVSRYAALEVAYRIKQGAECTRDRLDFVECYYRPGSVLPAMA